MFLGESVVGWMFVACFTAAMIVSFVSLKRICEELNRVLPPDRNVTLYPSWPRSLGQAIWRTNLLAHSLGLLDQHRQHYPSSSLRKVYGIAALSMLPSVIGVMAMTR
jgi:hypothetical protein